MRKELLGMSIPIIAIAVGLVALGLLLVAIAVYRHREGRGEPNYRALFAMGIIWLPVGIAMGNPGLWGMGFVFLIIGLVNRDKWGEERKWSDLSPTERRIKLVLLFGLTLLLIVGIAFYFLTKSNVLE
jgi:hypothetical protein